MKEEAREHPSFGMISISRYTGKSEFFCSDLVHSGGITLTISTAEEITRFANKRVFPKERVIQVRLSNSQYVELISSAMNTLGVPCTIEKHGDADIPKIHYAEEITTTHKKYLKDINKEYITRIDAISAKLTDTVSNKLRKELINDLSVLRSHLNSNSEFAETVFQESMENKIVEAQQSISNYIDSKITTLGLEAMKEQLEIKLIDN